MPKVCSLWRNPQQLNEKEMKMRTTPSYSNLVTCLYDEPEPVGNLGRGTHYSIFRSVEWLNVERKRLDIPEVHDFAVIWDEDHDTRIIPLIENIYMAGLLSPIQFFGERKGTLTVLVAARYRWWGAEEIDVFSSRLNEISMNMGGDVWHVEVGEFDRSPGSPHQTVLRGLIADSDDRVYTYLRTIDMLWSLGTKPYVPNRHFDPTIPPAPPSFPMSPPDGLHTIPSFWKKP
jgi:hypothetical protein